MACLFINQLISINLLLWFYKQRSYHNERKERNKANYLDLREKERGREKEREKLIITVKKFESIAGFI